MRSHMRFLRLVAVVGLFLLGSQGAARLGVAEEDGASEQPGVAAVGDEAAETATPTEVSEADDAPDSSPNAAVPASQIPETAEAAGSPAVPGERAEPVASAEPSAPVAAVPTPASVGLRVRVRLDVTGELFTAAGGNGAAIREPVTMNARFDFDERPGVAGGGTTRLYRDATASLEVAGQKTSTTLAADARRLLVARRGTTPAAYLENGFLTGDEADLLETPFDSLLLDDLLPKAAVRLEERWDVAADLVAGLLAIDTVESGGLSARIVEVAAGRAKVVVEGIIDGAADGVPTHVTVEGNCAAPVTTVPPGDAEAATDAGGEAYVFHGKVSQAAVVLRERRQPSHVAPGFDVEARLVVARGPLDSAAAGHEAAADDKAAAELASNADGAGPEAVSSRRGGAGAPGRLWHRDPGGRFDLVHDARWRRVEDGPHGLVLRLVDHGALVGQCSILCLPATAAAEPPTVADVRRDFERSLAGQVSRIESADEAVRADGLRVVRVEAAGTAGGLSFRWMHYVLTGAGSRASVTFMCEDPLRQRFGAADGQLVEGLRLLVDAAGGDPAGATAARPDGGVGPRR